VKLCESENEQLSEKLPLSENDEETLNVSENEYDELSVNEEDSLNSDDHEKL
jgi:hypothetical protein